MPNILSSLPTRSEEVEVADGLFISRRNILFGSISSFLYASFAPQIAAAQTISGENNSYENFLRLANPMTKSLITDTTTSGQDYYLHSLAALAARIDTVPEPMAWNDSTQSFTPGTEIGFTPGGESFTVLHWRMAANTEIRLHRHDYGNVVTLGLGGEAQVRNFELVGDNRDYIPGNIIKVRKTIDQQLSRGDINLVSLNRNNIHGFKAGPEGAHGLDITTRIRPKPEHSTPYLAVNKSAEDEMTQIYDAEWQN